MHQVFCRRHVNSRAVDIFNPVTRGALGGTPTPAFDTSMFVKGSPEESSIGCAGGRTRGRCIAWGSGGFRGWSFPRRCAGRRRRGCQTADLGFAYQGVASCQRMLELGAGWCCCCRSSQAGYQGMCRLSHWSAGPITGRWCQPRAMTSPRIDSAAPRSRWRITVAW